MEHYNRYMFRRVPMHAPPLTADYLRRALLEGGASAAGLDAWSYHDLRQAIEWQPRCLDIIADLGNLIERTGRWPDVLLDGFVCLIDKGPAGQLGSRTAGSTRIGNISPHLAKVVVSQVQPSVDLARTIAGPR